MIWLVRIGLISFALLMLGVNVFTFGAAIPALAQMQKDVAHLFASLLGGLIAVVDVAAVAAITILYAQTKEQ